MIVFLRNRLKYALNGREVKAILMQRHVKVDGKVRTDTTYPAGFMDVITLDATNENFRLVYDVKGRFAVHRITDEEASYKLGKVKKVQLGKKGVPYVVTQTSRSMTLLRSIWPLVRLLISSSSMPVSWFTLLVVVTWVVSVLSFTRKDTMVVSIWFTSRTPWTTLSSLD